MSQTETTRRPVRVLHVLKYYRPAFTGEGVFLERSSAVMQELAPEVEHELLVTHTPAPADPGIAAASTAMRRVIYLARRPLGTLQLHLTLAWWMLTHLHRYHTVHIRTHADWYFTSYILARLFGRRLVISATLDDSLPVLVGHYRPSVRPLVRRAFGLFHAFVGISPKLHGETRSLAPEERCHLIPCGITAPLQPPAVRARVRAEIGAAEGDPVLLFVGGLVERKDPLFLVEALPALRARHPGLRLVLVGPPLDPDYVAGLHATAERLGVAPALFFAGEQRDPHPWFAAADILVFASRLEGFGTVVPEGMAHGLPVVVRHLPGVNDSFVFHGRTGFLFDDQAGFVETVDRLAGSAALRREIGSAAQAFATTEFGMRGIAARYLDVYGLAGRMLRPPMSDLPDPGLGATASVLDQRFHLPVEPAPDSQPLLLTTVDAEESFDWSRPFSRDTTDVRAMGSQHLAHRVFDRHGVVPTYMVDYPVAAQREGAAPLLELLRDGRCDIGAQLHPWVNPPFLEELNRHNSYVGNLPAGLEYEKARRLTEIIADRLGVQPRIFRTGRFGAGPRTGDVLKRLGYQADSSLSVCWPPEGMDWQSGLWGFTAHPHWIDRDRTVMEIPASAALVGRLAARQGTRLAPVVFHPLAQRLPLGAALARLGLLERIRLTPEGIKIEEAKRLVRHMAADGHKVFVLTYHSPSLEPGNTPYTRTADDVKRMLDWLDAFYTFFREEIGGRPARWEEVRFGNRAAAPAAARLATVG
ncbi:glycosyltransferase [Falsiroseomonas oryzae]|uniref:glycosyltransferase n=1 Tax=Falsiroseomonas oryzae TaxID=2766473 RepID=UPI0022EA93A6|nr:glycosyltransferase [Roseomonas sp. MO-31]